MWTARPTRRAVIRHKSERDRRHPVDLTLNGVEWSCRAIGSGNNSRNCQRWWSRANVGLDTWYFLESLHLIRQSHRLWKSIYVLFFAYSLLLKWLHIIRVYSLILLPNVRLPNLHMRGRRLWPNQKITCTDHAPSSTNIVFKHQQHSWPVNERNSNLHLFVIVQSIAVEVGGTYMLSKIRRRAIVGEQINQFRDL